jgi:signal peptidase II
VLSAPLVTGRRGGWARAGAALALVLVIDQASKQLAVTAIERGQSNDVFFGLELTNTRNTGVAFGFLQGRGIIVGTLIAFALVLLLVYFALNAARPLLWLPVGMLLGGAIGNLVDRVREGAVIDFIDPVWWPAFNLADASIVLGVLILLYAMERPADTG